MDLINELNNSFSASAEFPRQSEAAAEPVILFHVTGDLFDDMKQVTFKLATTGDNFTFATDKESQKQIASECKRYDLKIARDYLHGLLERHRKVIYNPTSKHIEAYNTADRCIKLYGRNKSHYPLVSAAKALLPITHNNTSKTKLQRIINRYGGDL